MSFEPPQITDDDIAWVCDVLRLPRTAFTGADGMDPRLEVLRSSETLDIEACPGSGKTTLLIAKLAILARKWSSLRQGICVLSHTNVARRQIEKRLGNTAFGQRLLGYPHYVGTIHGFVNEFLAMPWLLSLGLPVRVIDNQLCEQHRRYLLKLAQFGALSSYVSQKEASDTTGNLNIVSKWRISSPDFAVLKESGDPEFKDQTKPAAMQLRTLAKYCANDGYHRFDEMFMWGHDLLDKYPGVSAAARQRFPMLFIDEVQDNNEDQSRVLNRLFIENGGAVRRQRYGDSNQAIYGYIGEVGATSDVFPDRAIRMDIPNSHRFGQQIADIAKPLGLVPQNLVGCGPEATVATADTTGKHTIFLFSDQTIQHVIPAYAQYLCELFSAPELKVGDFAVIAGVHRQGENDKVPRYLGHYWPPYDPDLTASEPKPATFCQYITAGRKRSDESGEAYHLVEKIAEGTLRLVRLSNPTADLRNRKNKHRYILELLAEKAVERGSYCELVTALVADRATFASHEWNKKWAPAIIGIAKAIGNSSTELAHMRDFMLWQPLVDDGAEAGSHPRDNLYRHPASSPKVKLRVGSIHSVKGETHTATLVLDTYFRRHHLATLKPWLLGTKAGKGTEGIENQSRLKQHYVAMTRPTHLLCLAMREDCFAAGEVELLRSRSWRVARVQDSGLEWL